MKTRKFFIASLLGVMFFSACSEKKVDPSEKDAVAQITVLDEAGKPLGGVPVLIYDEKGYAAFQQNRATAALAGTLTLPDGKVDYRLPYQKWFASGSRVVTFVVKEEYDMDNYHIWAISRTIKASEKVEIEFELDKNLPSMPGSGLEIFDENNGHTLLGGAAYLDASHNFVGGDRYSFVDAGAVSDLNALGELKLEGFTDKIAAKPQHGYFVCKDISMMEFPSGRWGVSIDAEYMKMYVTDWLYRDGKIVGIAVQYLIQQPADHGLPAWDTVYDTKLADGGAVTISLPTEFGTCECVPAGNASLQFSYGAGHVTVRTMDPAAVVGKEYRFYIRVGVYYTAAKLRIAA